MTRCKVGDLCIIVGSDFPENLGREVVVVEQFGTHQGEVDWIVESNGLLTGVWHGRLAKSAKFRALDSDLLPINPKQEETIETEQEITA